MEDRGNGKLIKKDKSNGKNLDLGRPWTRKQAYREYTTELLRMGMGGRRVGTQNEGVARSEGVSSGGSGEWDSEER